MTATLSVQVVVYDNDATELVRLASGIGASVRHALDAGSIGAVRVVLGDSSHEPSLSADDVAALREALAVGHADVEYHFFDANLGSGGGSNRLMDLAQSDLVWILNPDTVPAPTALTELVSALKPADVAAVDARQIPIENPKGYDPESGDAAWVSGACMLVRRSAADEVDGFDPDFFPMYCDDVDFSWRLRCAGWRVRHAPLAVVFHDKRLGHDGRPEASDYEHESGVLSRLFLAHRYGRPDLVDTTLAWVDANGSTAHRRAASTYRERLAEGDVPTQIADSADVADLDSDFYGPARFRY